MKELVPLIAIGLAGLYLLSKRKQYTIAYFNKADKPAVDILAKGLQQRGIPYKIVYKPLSVKPPVILIGGQRVNPYYKDLVDMGVLPSLRVGYRPRVVVKPMSDGTIYIAGITADDTIEGARLFLTSL